MARRTNTKLKNVDSANLQIAPNQKVNLKVAQNPIVKCKPYNDIDLNNPYATSGSDPLSNNGSANPYTNLQTERKYYEPDKDVSDYNNQK